MVPPGASAKKGFEVEAARAASPLDHLLAHRQIGALNLELAAPFAVERRQRVTIARLHFPRRRHDLLDVDRFAAGVDDGGAALNHIVIGEDAVSQANLQRIMRIFESDGQGIHATVVGVALLDCAARIFEQDGAHAVGEAHLQRWFVEFVITPNREFLVRVALDV